MRHRADQADVVAEARVDAVRHLDDFSGAPVGWDAIRSLPSPWPASGRLRTLRPSPRAAIHAAAPPAPCRHLPKPARR